MSDRFRLAVVGVGRIGVFHALHVQELARERGDCVLAAVVDGYGDLSEQVARRLQEGQEGAIRAFHSVGDLLGAGMVDGAVIASRTEDHYADARTLIDAGLRVLLEKPLTHSLPTAREFCAYLNGDEKRGQGLMQAFMRRFDAPLLRVREMLEQGVVGTPFKVVSVLEDPLPPPDGYNSPGLLLDMAVHNIDEVTWLLGRRPEMVSGLGAVLYNQKISSVREDLDDAFLQMWFSGDLAAQVQVSRNHVAGYRNETWVYGEEGLIHVGHFAGDPRQVTFEAYGRRQVIEQRSFALRDYGEQGPLGKPVPVFMERFGAAYKGELACYLERCLSGEPFPVDHVDGLRALEVAAAGSRALRTQEHGGWVEYAVCD